jgi:hypothetical protein
MDPLLQEKVEELGAGELDLDGCFGKILSTVESRVRLLWQFQRSVEEVERAANLYYS